MCATKNKSCVMLHHTHDVTQGISSDVAKSDEVKWHCTDPTEVRTFAPWATGSFEDGHHGTYGYNTYRTSIWPCPINQGQDFIDLGIVQIAELFTLRCDQTLSVSGSPKSYYNIRWITAVQGHVRNFFIFWLGSFLCGQGLEDKHCDADLVRVNEYFWVFLPVFSCLFFRQAL